MVWLPLHREGWLRNVNGLSVHHGDLTQNLHLKNPLDMYVKKKCTYTRRRGAFPHRIDQTGVSVTWYLSSNLGWQWACLPKLHQCLLFMMVSVCFFSRDKSFVCYKKKNGIIIKLLRGRSKESSLPVGPSVSSSLTICLLFSEALFTITTRNIYCEFSNLNNRDISFV